MKNTNVKLTIFTDFIGNPYILEVEEEKQDFFEKEYLQLHPNEILPFDFEKSSIFKIEFDVSNYKLIYKQKIKKYKSFCHTNLNKNNVNITIITDFLGNPYIVDIGDLNMGIVDFFSDEFSNFSPKEIFKGNFIKSSIYSLNLYFSSSWNYEYTECEVNYKIVKKKLILQLELH